MDSDYGRQRPAQVSVGEMTEQKNNIKQTYIMMIKKSLTLIAALALMLTGCSNEENSPSNVTKGTPIKVNAFVEELTGGLSNKTEVTGSNFSQFCLQITNTGNADFSYYAWMKHDATTNAWKAYTDNTYTEELPMYWAGDNNDVIVTAASFDFKDLMAISPDFANDQTDEANFTKNDFLLRQPISVEQSDKGIEVLLSHIMATFTVNINLGTGVTDENNPVTDMKISGPDCARRLVMQEYNRYEWRDGESANKLDITPHFVSYTKGDATTSAKVTYEAFVMPQSLEAGNMEISFTYGGKPYTYSTEQDITFAENTPYSMTLNMPTE